MNKLPTLGLTATLVSLAVTASADVVVKQAPLTWQGGRHKRWRRSLPGTLRRMPRHLRKGAMGPAAQALKKPVADLTVLAANNGGEFPLLEVQETIRRK